MTVHDTPQTRVTKRNIQDYNKCSLESDRKSITFHFPNRRMQLSQRNGGPSLRVHLKGGCSRLLGKWSLKAVAASYLVPWSPLKRVDTVLTAYIVGGEARQREKRGLASDVNGREANQSKKWTQILRKGKPASFEGENAVRACTFGVHDHSDACGA